jgi:Uma2 family endonuclease
MSLAFAPSPPSGPLAPQRISVAQYEAMIRAGEIGEDDGVELLDGWIVPKMGKNPLHDGTVDLIDFLLSEVLPAGWFVRVQNAVVTADSTPEPDLAVVRGQPGDFRQRHPTGTDVALIVEVADTTLTRDRAKALIYARAGVPHYWIVNLANQQVMVYSQPTGSGFDATYQSQSLVVGDDLLPVVIAGQTADTLTARRLFS